MTGYQDRAAAMVAWSEAQMALLQAEIEDGVRALREGERLVAGDAAGVERKGRATGVLARSIQSLVRLESAIGRLRPPIDKTDNEMEDGDDSPETCARLRAELESDFDRLHGRLEAAGVVVEPGHWPAARTEGRLVRPA